jgi:excisionase family DNA binding protein
MATSNDPFANVVFPDVMDLRLASVYLSVSEGRIRTLLREGTIKSTKDDNGHWSVTKADLDAYVQVKATSPRKSGGASGTGKAYIVKVPFAKIQVIKDALAKEGVELLPRYDYSKQKAYQAKQKAAKAAKKAAEKALTGSDPKPATPASPFPPKK